MLNRQILTSNWLDSHAKYNSRDIRYLGPHLQQTIDGKLSYDYQQESQNKH